MLCLFCNPSFWSSLLDWTEYAHNTLVLSSTGITFSMFSWLSTSSVPGARKGGILFLSVDHHPAIPEGLEKNVSRVIAAIPVLYSNAAAGNTRCSSTPHYQMGHQVWFPMWDLLLTFQTSCVKLVPHSANVKR